MPASIVKTPNSASTRSKDASIAANGTKSTERKNVKDASSTGSAGKKLVQTRLPFKLLTPVAKSTAAATSSVTVDLVGDADEQNADELAPEPEQAREPRKRKLSYSDAEAPAEQLRRSNSKENLNLDNAPVKKPKTVELVVDTIDLIDDDDIDDDVEAEEDDAAEADGHSKIGEKFKIAEKFKTAEKSKEAEKSKNAEKSKSAEKSKTEQSKTDKSKNTEKSKTEKSKNAEKLAHVQIKLPLNNKRAKRHKLKKLEPVAVPLAAERSDSSDDIEAIAEQLNPQKRAKVIAVKSKASTSEKQAKPEALVEAKQDVESKTAEVLLDNSDSEAKHEEDVAAEPTIEEMDVDEDMNDETLNKDEEQSLEAEGEGEDEEHAVEAGEEKEGEDDSSASAMGNLSEKLQNLTPKQQKLWEQRRKAREEKERKLQEERRQKQQEKEQREQLKKAEREQKEEQRRKERDDKEEVRRKEREEKERKRQAEVDSKNEEKRKRNEVREELQRKKDEERRRKEHEKEEAEQKKKRVAAAFTKFFVPKQPRASIGNCPEHEQHSSDSSSRDNSSTQSLAFRPFQIKDDMSLAPIIRTQLAAETRQQLDNLFHDEAKDEDEQQQLGRTKRPTRAQLYLSELSLGKHKPLRSKRNVRLQKHAKDEDDDDDVQVIEDELANAGTPIVEERTKQLPWMRTKYLHFADNRRPPYYGTWRKVSQLISARRPLGQDKVQFDYEVDSDCEWEEEEPGESLSASEDEKERESEEESEEEYNEWFVPHGHLSDEELQNDDELDDANTREAQQAKLQVLQQEFVQEMKKQTKKIKPRLLGPVWLDENGNKSQLCPAVFIQTIDMYASWQLQPLSLEPSPEPIREPTPEPTTLQLDEPLLQQLVRLIHGNSNAKTFLISEYLEYLKLQLQPESQTLLPSKTLLREHFDELASWKPIELPLETTKTKKPKKRLCWVVNAESLHKFQLDELTLKNQWNYTLTPRINKLDNTSLSESTPPIEIAEAIGTPKSNKTKLTKREETLPTTPSTSAAAVAASAPSPTATVIKKRAQLLMSVPRDQQFHAPTKNALISQYLRKHSDDTNSVSPSPKPPPPTPISDDIVMLSD